MKRLVKNLFAGFVCSALLMGCQGQEIEDTRIPVEKANELFSEIVDYYNTQNESFDAEYYRNAYEGTFFLILYSEEYTFSELLNISFLAGEDSVNSAMEIMEKNFNEDVVVPTRELGYEGKIRIIVKSSDKKEIYSFTIGISEDEISTAETFLFQGFDLSSVEPEQSQVGIGEVFDVGNYTAYYSKTPYGEEVLNIHIDDDYLQVADIEAYYNLVANYAIGCSFVVMTFKDYSNCVIDLNTMSYVTNQDINYYRN